MGRLLDFAFGAFDEMDNIKNNNVRALVKALWSVVILGALLAAGMLAVVVVAWFVTVIGLWSVPLFVIGVAFVWFRFGLDDL